MHRVMIIEDDVMIQSVFRQILESEGFEVLTQDQGAGGIEAVRRNRPDIVILDMNLPDMSGMDVCRALKADAATRPIPVLILTGEAREVVQRVQGLDLGAEDYLFKPIDSKVLIARLRSILRTTRPN